MLGRASISLIIVLLLSGCYGPDEAVVGADFEALVAKEFGEGLVQIVYSMAPGEGDSANVHMHIAFDLLARNDIVFRSGWLEGRTVGKGARLSGGELVILYQKSEDGQWGRRWHQLTRLPSPPD